MPGVDSDADVSATRDGPDADGVDAAAAFGALPLMLLVVDLDIGDACACWGDRLDVLLVCDDGDSWSSGGPVGLSSSSSDDRLLDVSAGARVRVMAGDD